MDMQQEKAKKLYRNKNGFICLWLAAKLRKQINPFFIFAAWRVSKLASDTPRGGSTT